jgi:ABC-type glutathione transport system ATPase component
MTGDGASTEAPVVAGDMPAERAAPVAGRDAALAEVRSISKHYELPRNLWERRRAKVLRAVDNVSLAVPRSKTVVLVGESGSGKTTLGRLFLRLLEPTGGSAWFQGRDLATLPVAELRRTRPRMQIVFQNPHGSLNPRFTVRETIAEGPRAHGLAQGESLTTRVQGLLDRMGLPAAYAERLPAELSGGERQRVAIARALSVCKQISA